MLGHGESMGHSKSRHFVLRENTWQFYYQHFPVNFTVYGNFYSDFPFKICVKMLRFPVKKK